MQTVTRCVASSVLNVPFKDDIAHMLSFTFPQRWISSKHPSHESTYSSHVSYSPAVCPNLLDCVDVWI